MGLKACSFCKRPKGEIEVLVTSQDSAICDLCLRKNILLINKNTRELLPAAEDVLGLTMAEIMEIDRYGTFSLNELAQKTSSDEKISDKHSLFNFLVVLGELINKARVETGRIKNNTIPVSEHVPEEYQNALTRWNLSE